MTDEQIHKLFNLIQKTSFTKRDNLYTLYLSRIDEYVIDFAIEYYRNEKKAELRRFYLKIITQYARTEKRVIDIAKVALNDRSKIVRQKALSILAYSLKIEHLALLEGLKEKLKGNEVDVQNAINCIKKQNHDLFYPMYHSWYPTNAQWFKTRHLDKEEYKKDIDYYIAGFAKELVPDLEKIFGTIYV